MQICKLSTSLVTVTSPETASVVEGQQRVRLCFLHHI